MVQKDLRNFQIKVVDCETEQTFAKATRNWQDEAAVVDHELRERMTTLTLSCFSIL